MIETTAVGNFVNQRTNAVERVLRDTKQVEFRPISGPKETSRGSVGYRTAGGEPLNMGPGDAEAQFVTLNGDVLLPE